MWNSTNVFICNMAVSDIVISLTAIPLTPLTAFTGRDPSLYLYVRYSPKVIFQNDNLPRAFYQVVTSQMCNFLFSQVCSSRSDRPLPLQKAYSNLKWECPKGKLSFGNLPLGKRPLGKHLTLTLLCICFG